MNEARHVEHGPTSLPTAHESQDHRPADQRAAAFFDVDGTLVRTTIVHYYAYFRRSGMSGWTRRLWSTAFLGRCLVYLILDKIDRSWFNRVFYRNYGGMSAGDVRGQVESCFQTILHPNLYPAACARVELHRREGLDVVLVTGSIDFLIAPLARELGVEHVVAPGLVERDGRFTGELDGPPIGEAEKARRIRQYAADHNIDLTRSFAYGDSVADLPMLESVGFPVAINPDRALAAVARKRGWNVLHWQLDATNGQGQA